MEIKKSNLKNILTYGCALLVYSIVLVTITIVIGKPKLNKENKKDNKDINKKEIIIGNEVYNLTSYNNNICQYKNWIIYSGGVELANGVFGNKIEGIYKYNVNNGQVICLSDYNGSNFNIIGDTLYYINKFGDIYSVNLESNEKALCFLGWISNSDYKASNLLIYDNSIFYTDSNGYNIYETDLKGSKKTLVAEYTTGAFQIYDGFIYYRENQTCKLYRKNLKVDSQSEVLLNDAVDCFAINGEKIYYRIGDSLKVYDISSIENNTLVENITSNFVSDSDNLYYYSSKSKALKKYNIEDGEEKELIGNFEKDIYRLQMYDNNIFYKIVSNSSNAQIYYYNIEEEKENFININYK